MSRAAALISKAFLKTPAHDYKAKYWIGWSYILYLRMKTNQLSNCVCLLAGGDIDGGAKEKYHQICQTGLFKISPHIVGSFKDTMTQESLLKNQGKYVKFVSHFLCHPSTSHFMH